MNIWKKTRFFSIIYLAEMLSEGSLGDLILNTLHLQYYSNCFLEFYLCIPWLCMHASTYAERISVFLSSGILPAKPREKQRLHSDFFPFVFMHVPLMLKSLRVLLLLNHFVLWHSGWYSLSSLHTAAAPRLA